MNNQKVFQDKNLSVSYPCFEEPYYSYYYSNIPPGLQKVQIFNSFYNKLTRYKFKIYFIMLLRYTIHFKLIKQMTLVNFRP